MLKYLWRSANTERLFFAKKVKYPVKGQNWQPLYRKKNLESLRDQAFGVFLLSSWHRVETLIYAIFPKQFSLNITRQNKKRENKPMKENKKLEASNTELVAEIL